MEATDQPKPPKAVPALDKLSRGHRRFALEYLIDRNATQAAIRAKFSRKTAGSIGCQLLKRPDVRAAIDEEMQRINEDATLKAHEISRELSRIGAIDSTSIYNEDGSFKKISEMPEDVRRAISSIEMESIPITKHRPALDKKGQPIPGKTEEVTEFVQRIKKISFWNKNEALGLLARHRKMLTDKHEVTGKDGQPLAPPMLDLSGVDLELLKKIAEGS